MHALRLKEIGNLASLKVEEFPVPEPVAGQVLVRVAACGISFPDLLIAKGKYQIRPTPPFTLGGEFAGTITETGTGVAGLKKGDHVAGFVNTGAFADYILVKETDAFKIPRNVSFEDAAAFALNYATAYSALRFSAEISEGETLLVLGAGGGIGSAAVDIGKVLKAQVIAAASSDDKLAICESYRPDYAINYTTQDFRETLRSITGDGGIDVVIDPVGGSLSEAAFRRLGWRGRHVVLGFAAGEIPKLPLNLPLLKGASLLGISVGAFAKKEPKVFASYMREIFDLLGEGRLKPNISCRFRMESIPQALELLENREAKGKMIAVFEKE